MAQAWYEYAISNPYSGNPNGGEMGVDLGTPFGTPVTALYAGTVRWAGRTQWACGSSGGEVTIVCNVPGYGVMTSYYLHLNDATVAAGDTVHQGQLIGHTGGQLSGGHWPVVNCKGITYSTGPHIEFGFNAPWVSGPGRNVNPTFAITQARNGTLPDSSPNGTNTTPTPANTPGASPSVTIDPSLVEAGLLAYYNMTSATHTAITQPSGFDGICEAINDAEQFAEWNWFNPFGSIAADFRPWLIRQAFLTIAFFIILFVFWEAIQPQLDNALRIAGMVAAPETGGASLAAEQAPTALAR